MGDGGHKDTIAMLEVKEDLQAAIEKLANPKKAAFLEAFVVFPHVGRSCQAASISMGIHYHWLYTDPDYVAAYAIARKVARVSLVDEAVKRAIEGQESIVLDKQGGEHVVHKTSDTMLAMRLNGFIPEHFKQRTEVTGRDGGPIEMSAYRKGAERLTVEELRMIVDGAQRLLEARVEE